MNYIGVTRTRVVKPKTTATTSVARQKDTSPNAYERTGVALYSAQKICPIPLGISNPPEVVLPAQLIVQGLAYDVTEHLCTGGVGEVYLAIDPATQRDVVIKTPRMEDYLPFLEAEAKELLALSGTGIAPEIRNFDSETGHLVADYIKGKTLRAILEEKGRLSVPEAIEITMSICFGLEQAAKKGRLHADLKPDNIMFDEQWKAVILDFSGEAYHYFRQNDPDVIFFNPHYTPHEQRDGKKIGHYTDIFALGYNIYEMLTGKVLSEEQVEKGELPRDHNIPAIIYKILRKMTKPETNKRYQTWDAVIYAFKQAAEHWGLDYFLS